MTEREEHEMQDRTTEAGANDTARDNSGVAQGYDRPTEPDSDVRSLDRLVGRWEVSGGARGTTIYEWMEGGFFLIQRVELDQDGQAISGLEIIGRERPFMAEPSPHIKSRFYSNSGDTLDYVYELEGDTLTIWAGDKGSPAHYRGTFTEDGNTLTGGWAHPDGGYEATSTRVE
jgi:hypothetical protein